MGTLSLIGKSLPQRPCMTNWVMYRADPQMLGGICSYFPAGYGDVEVEND